MAVKRTLNFLPIIFRTAANQKFLSATLDQLISEPQLKNINGYIGRKFAPTFKSSDSYIVEADAVRQDYQLEPSVIYKKSTGETDFFSSYTNYLNKISYYGGITTNHNRLFESEYYTYNPLVSFDKFVNFGQYYWLKDGPDTVSVNTTGVDIVGTYTVTRNEAANRYEFSINGSINNTITFARGGQYKFIVNQPGFPFWIQSERGIDGMLNAVPTISTRDVLGVDNNGADVGEIIFNVPSEDSQVRFTSMEVVATVDYAASLAYSQIQNQTVSDFLEMFPQFGGIIGTSAGKTLVFVDQDQLTNFGDSAWTVPTITDSEDVEYLGWEEGTLINESLRYQVWKINLNDTIIDGEVVIRLIPDQTVNLNEKVYIKYGIVNANREYYKDYDGFFKLTPLITSIQGEMYYQDGIAAGIYGTFKLVDILGWNIDVENDIINKKTYTSPNGVKFTSGLRISFGTDVKPDEYKSKEFYVECVGENIQLVDVSLLDTPELYNDELELNYDNETFPDYFVINRASQDVNAWTRNNRWFHRSVIEETATYNNTAVELDQTLRARRPIVEFDSNIQLFNFGKIGKASVYLLDTITTDAYTDLQGKIIPTLGGIALIDGMRIIFTNDNDPLVKNKICVLHLVQYEADDAGNPTGAFHVHLSTAEDGSVEPYDTVVVTGGSHRGEQWWYDGADWVYAQQKTALQQEPLFDIFNKSGQSFSTYLRSTFVGDKIFGYKRETTYTVNDSVLGFPLSYRNIGTQGDIEFQNYYVTDTFEYAEDQFERTLSVRSGLIHINIDRYAFSTHNTWENVVESSKQYQVLTFDYEDESTFELAVTPTTRTSVPTIKVYVNNGFLESTNWTSSGTTVIINSVLVTGDKVDILVFSNEVAPDGYYQIPLNLDLNAQNNDVESLTLGQIRNHLVELSHNSLDVIGNIVGISNLRDVDVKHQGGNILQHSAPVPYGEIFLVHETLNFVNALRLAQQEYYKFKNKFLELSITLQGIDPTDPAASVDLILTSINAIKNKNFPWYYSDMVPYGTAEIVEYTIFNPLTKVYEISSVFDDKKLSNRAVIVYHNGEQLIKDQDYVFSGEQPAIVINNSIVLVIDDILKIVEYPSTDGNYIPETPTKLGLYPKFMPEIFVDDTYREPISVIRGHDGSITPAFNDYRDDFILELEKRIFNNIKVTSDTSDIIYSVLAGKFRDGDYQLNEINQVLSQGFLSWVGNNKINFAVNDTFESNDPFTWNYSSFVDRIDGEQLPGSWRACYQYFYDTLRPHLTPWEMLGFSIKPDWWEEYYGPAPYTGGNKLLWEDLEEGKIVDGDRAGIDSRFARPGLTSIIPIDENGFLQSPAQILTQSFSSKYAATSWAVGHMGPAEAAWRNSSDYPFSVNLAVALAKPARYFGMKGNTQNYALDEDTGQYLINQSYHIKQTDLTFNGRDVDGTIERTAGYINWIADCLINQGMQPTTTLLPLLQDFKVNLAYQLSGFSDQKYLKVFAEQNSPSSTNDSIIIPNENYNIHLHKSAPVSKVVYSSVIVERVTNGFTVRGYDLNNPFFSVIPSVVNNNVYKITVLNSSATIFKDYQNLILTVPYGYEFKNQQQVADFLVSYERYLIAQGFVFDEIEEQLAEVKNWKLSIKEFLFWAQQGWKQGSVLVLSPVSNSLKLNTLGNITDAIIDSPVGPRVIDQNFKIVKNNNYHVARSATSFNVTLTNDAVFGFAELNLVQFEHVLVFDNSTVFNDIIYKPELGNRQFRLKLVGQKTDNWDGSLHAPGFIYQSGVILDWIVGKDYLKGDLVKFKDKFYVALEKIIGTTEFSFDKWTNIDKSEIKSGLLPNFSSIASKFKSYYDSYGYFNDSDQVKFSHGLIGFKPRQYLDELGLNETTQIEFYKGYIKQKGTLNAVNQLTRAQFNNLTGSINFYEEWAIRIGEYGALDTNPFIEIQLAEKEFSVNPAIASFVDIANSNEGDGVTVFNKLQLHRSFGEFTGNIALIRTDSSIYENDILTAGYVNIDDVDATIFDLADYYTLSDKLDFIGSGYTIWVAKDFTRQWNVYRITETNNRITTLTNSLDGFITFTALYPHELSKDEIVLIRNFDSVFDGFYQVYTVVSLTEITVKFSGSQEALDDLTTIDNEEGIFFRLDSLRFKYMEDAREYVPPNGWKKGEKIWIDIDAAASTKQGQPVDVPENNTWKVYEKAAPWTTKQTLDKSLEQYFPNDGFGTSLKISDDALLAVVGSPQWGTAGTVFTFLRNYLDEFVDGLAVNPTGNLAAEFGQSVDLAEDYMVVGAPGSFGNIGQVYVYQKAEYNAAYNIRQLIMGNVAATGDRFGSSVAYDETGDWLYVGAPGNDRVYVYGLNKTVTRRILSTSINNEHILTLSGPITANIGDRLTQPATGADVTVTNSVVSSIFVKVNSITNIVNGIIVATGDYGNITVNQVNVHGDIVGSFDTGYYPNAVPTSTPVVNSIALTFVPDVANAAESLLVTTNGKTFIPYVDYTLSNTAVKFTANVSTNDITIEQHPYYHLITVLQGATGSDFGYALDASYDGAQLAIGVPGATINGLEEAGSVHVYDRVIEAFNSTGLQDYTTTGNIGSVVAVSVDNESVSNYSVVGTNTIRFTNPPALGRVVYVETNAFNLLELLTGSVVQSGARFGTSLTVCSNNCAIYIGAPYYDNGTIYNTGSVFKFHNRGRLYGTNTGTEVNPTFTVGDTIRLDNFEVAVTANIATVTINYGGNNYSQGSTITFGAPTSEWGIAATGSVSIFTANGTAYSADITSSGSGYISSPAVTITKPGNVTTAISSFVGGGYTATLVSISNLYVGMFANVANGNIATTAYITSINSLNSSVVLSETNTGTVEGFVTFWDKGTAANITATLSTTATLDSFVADINGTSILGVSAVNEDGKLRLNSDKTVAKNLLRVLSGTGTIFADAGLAAFAEMQIIVNPFNNQGEYFGSKVVLASNAYMLVISSERGTTRDYTTFDDESMTFDNTTTQYYDLIKGSGSVYIYELYDDPRNAVEHPGRYSYAQQLNPDNLNPGDKFGAAIDIVGHYIVVSAPGDDTTVEDAGSIYIFQNLERTRGWNLIRYQQSKVDIDSVNRLYLFDKISNTIITNVEFIDPAKGKILGQAEQEISFKTEYDPAIYNRGNNPSATIDENIYWNGEYTGRVWWNINKVRYMEYEQGTHEHRSINWGRLFPNSEIEVLEWVESSVIPSEYSVSDINGEPKYPDNSAYAEVLAVNKSTNVVGSKYYFWVKNKSSLGVGIDFRSLPLTIIQQLIENPKSNGTTYAGIIDKNALILYNAGQHLSGTDTVLHIDSEVHINDSIIHSEYELVKYGDPTTQIPPKITTKMIDSLSGIDEIGQIVPDPKLVPSERYGIAYRPRQSMFIDRLQALSGLILYVNDILIDLPLSNQIDFTSLEVEDPIPASTEYDEIVETEQELEYLNIELLPTGYRVLVHEVSSQDGLWVIYKLLLDKTWEIERVQGYKTQIYWYFIDWYAQGYDESTKIKYVADTLVDALQLSYAVGDIIKIVNAGKSEWLLIEVATDLSFTTIGTQNGTIQFSDILSDFENQGIGFGNQGFAISRYDQNPNFEIRQILLSLRDVIFTGALQENFNNTFFIVVNYLLSEQKYVDWIFKTSFVSVFHNLRNLDQYPSYIKDNQTYYQDYINEIKPYSTKIREYLLDYTGSEEWDGNVTDFDLPPYYDLDEKIFRSPSGELVAKDEQLWQTAPYDQWYNSRDYGIGEIVVSIPGYGYLSEPGIIIQSGGEGGSGATATAVIDFDTGELLEIIVTNPGSGYVTNVNVIINGSSDIPAVAYARLVNNKVRSVDTSLKFDRITYTSSIVDWAANTAYTANAIISYNGIGYLVNSNLVTGTTFVSDDYTVVPAGNLANANDRIMAYYSPSENMPAKDLRQLIAGIEYPGVTISGVNFSLTPFFSGAGKVELTLDVPITANVGSYLTQPEADILVKFTGSLGATVGNYITQTYVGAGNLMMTANAAVYWGGEQDQAYLSYVDPTVFKLNVIVSVNGTPTSVAPIIISDIVDANITVTAGGVSTYVVSGVLNATTKFKINSGNIRVNGTWISADITNYEYISNQESATYDQTPFDSVDYDDDGLPLLSSASMDTIVQSEYIDTALGTRPEDILVDGGAYIDVYGSHAPEELIPGRTYDTLNLQVYTKILGNAAILGHRIFVDMLQETHYLRISSAYTTELAQDLHYADTEIFVADASVLPNPSKELTIPGVVFINGERITYYRNYIYEVVDWISNISYATDSILSYGNLIIFNSAIDINPGDYITQGNANARVVTTEVNLTRAYINYVSVGNVFTLSTGGVQIIDGSNVANVTSISAMPTSSEAGYYKATEAMPASLIFDITKIDPLVSINTIGQLRRNTLGTGIPEFHYTGTSVVDAGVSQIIPGVGVSSIYTGGNVTYNTTETVPYYLRLNANVTVTVGEYIYQPFTGANAVVTGVTALSNEFISLSENITASAGVIIEQQSSNTRAELLETANDTNYVYVRYIRGEFIVGSGSITLNGISTTSYPTAASTRGASSVRITYITSVGFDFIPKTLILSDNILVSPGYIITQTTSGANAYAVAETLGTSTISIRFNTFDDFDSIGNLFVNGTDSGLKVVSQSYAAESLYAIQVNGTIKNSSPVVTVTTGEVDVNGNVTIIGNVNLRTDLQWYNLGGNTVTDGTGFDGSTTLPVLFLKGSTAEVTGGFELVDEDVVNILTTEDSVDLYADFGGN